MKNKLPKFPIIDHVEHGKTTLVGPLLQQLGTLWIQTLQPAQVVGHVSEKESDNKSSATKPR